MNLQFLKSAVRWNLKNKTGTYINIVGLSVGLAVILLLLNIVGYEKSFDKFNHRLDDIYCIVTKDQHSGSSPIGWNESVPALPRAMMNEFPEVEQASLVQNGKRTMQFKIGNQIFKEKVQFASPNLFKIFSFPLLSGNIPAESTEKNILALSKSSATKFFGNTNPLGKLITINNKYEFRIVAVFDDIPKNSSLRFDCWAPIGFLPELNQFPNYLNTWYNLSFQSYVLLAKGASPENVNKRLKGRIIQSNPDSQAESQLYPYSNLHTVLYGRNKRIKMVSAIAVIIFILISINFINLKTVDTFQRIKEFGIRKINGAGKGYIFKQLMLEASLVIIVSAALSLFIIYFSIPTLKNLTGISGTLTGIFTPASIVMFLVSGGLIALISALIPSLTLRSNSPVNSLKAKVNETISVSRLRTILSGVQFGLAIGLIICTLFTIKQLSYLRNFDLGFNKEQIVRVDLQGPLQSNYKVLQDELRKNPNILSSTAASRNLTGIYWNGDGFKWEGKPANVDPLITFIETDDNFCKTFDIKMLDGDYFKTRKPGAVVINKTLADIISPDGNALNKKIIRDTLELEVTGITNNFNFKPLNRSIGPLMFIKEAGLDNMRYLFVKIAPTHVSGTLGNIEKTVKKLNPDFLFSYHFLDDEFAKLYNGEERLQKQLSLFSFIAIIISVMGLWGILLFVIQQRTKEIGIRKVNGANVSEVMTLLNKDFIKWVSIAFVIATPIAWFAMHKWLENFAYKTSLSWWIFALAGILALGIALLTVSWQSWKAATRNPVEALRYE
ncbi:ABC transporter permease [Prolixibacter bellariivorans]|uniref:ABC transporter permease n=1 Tax=Prolixibacter bellariivorans TaxID=314319 RepID=A0A5M4B1X2_9BACT|nr:ABC transporter permease [Prolixibacter bellariivorans]GET34145.1 ABC transporter permease [Prolixibacter bellariivorans]